MAKILLVEDDIPLMRLYEGALSLEYDVLTADTTSQAIQLLDTQSIDLVILDLNLPDAPGTTILKHLQTHQPELRVVVMTGFSHYRQEALPDVVAEVLSKPVTTSMLLRVTHAAISSRVG